MGMSHTTAHRLANKFGKKRKAVSVIHLSPEDRKKRSRFAVMHRHDDFKRWTWADDKPLKFPPQAPRNKYFWRRDGSNKPIPRFSKEKHQSVIQMFVAVNWNGKSKPIFNVCKQRMKRGRKTDGVRGFRYHKTKITKATRSADIRNELKPMMDATNSDALVLDNAPCQQYLGPLLDELKIAGPGFGSVNVDDDGGVPPRSPDTSVLDAGVFKKFDLDFRLSNPRNTAEAIARAKKIWDSIPQSEIREYIRGFGDRLQSMIDNNGGHTEWMGSKFVSGQLRKVKEKHIKNYFW